MWAISRPLGPEPCPLRLPRSRARMTQTAERALGVGLSAVEAARVHHPEVAEREVVLDRVVRIEHAQRRSNVAGHSPARARIGRELQTAADPDDVGVERYDEAGRRDTRPHAEIERVLAHHPAQEQIQTLAGRPYRRTRKEIADAGTPRHPPVGRPEIERERTRREAVERALNVHGRGLVTPSEERLD